MCKVARVGCQASSGRAGQPVSSGMTETPSAGRPRRRWTLAPPRWKLARTERVESMDKATMEVLARRAWLAKALAEFPDDVTAAAKQAADVVAKIKQPADRAAEPWPPMKAGRGL